MVWISSSCPSCRFFASHFKPPITFQDKLKLGKVEELKEPESSREIRLKIDGEINKTINAIFAKNWGFLNLLSHLQLSQIFLYFICLSHDFFTNTFFVGDWNAIIIRLIYQHLFSKMSHNCFGLICPSPNLLRELVGVHVNTDFFWSWVRSTKWTHMDRSSMPASPVLFLELIL